MPNPEQGPKVPEAALEGRLNESSALVKETASNLLREGGERAAAEFLAMIDSISRLVTTDLPSGVERSKFVDGCWKAERALADGIHFGATNPERLKALAEGSDLLYHVESSLPNQIRGAIKTSLGSVGSGGSILVKEWEL